MQTAKFPSCHQPGKIYDRSPRLKLITNAVYKVATELDELVSTLPTQWPQTVLFDYVVNKTREALANRISNKQHVSRAEVASALKRLDRSYEFKIIKVENL